MQLSAGDIVRLKSGGPLMTIRWIEDGQAYREWFDGKENRGASFTVPQLEKG